MTDVVTVLSVRATLAVPKNPYRPGVGLSPPHLAGREQDEFRRVLASAPEIPGNVRLTGLRGVGKTVLLQKFSQIADEEGWSSLLLEVQPRQSNETELILTLSERLQDLVQRLSSAARLRAKVIGLADGVHRMARVGYEGFEWSLAGDLESRTAELGQQLVNTVEAALDRDRFGLVLLLDEAQILTDDKRSDGDHPLSTLIAAVSAVQKEQVPIGLVLCGLPTLAVNLLAAGTYTERMFRGVEVASLNDEAAREAFVEPLSGTGVQADPDLVDAVMAEVEGYPYFVQLWGAELWEATQAASLERMTRTTLDEVRERIYQTRPRLL